MAGVRGSRVGFIDLPAASERGAHGPGSGYSRVRRARRPALTSPARTGLGGAFWPAGVKNGGQESKKHGPGREERAENG